MKIINNTSYSLVAFGWHMTYGYGKDVEIPSGQSAEIFGPYVGEMDGGGCHIVIKGEIVCQETPDNKNGFQVILDSQLNLRTGDNGVIIRHCLENRVIS